MDPRIALGPHTLEMSGAYHYHSLPRCVSTGSARAHSKRIGWGCSTASRYSAHAARAGGFEHADEDEKPDRTEVREEITMAER